MADTILQRMTKAWNVIRNRTDPASVERENVYTSSGNGGRRPDRGRLYFGGERTILSSVLTKIAVDVSSAKVQHVRVEDDRYKETMTKSGLNDCLTFSANVDQSGRAFILDAAISVITEGAIAIVPVDTDKDPSDSSQFDVLTMRVGTIKEWAPLRVKVDLYNEQTGNHQEIWVNKSFVAVVENPFYNIMNEPNSTLKRLVRKLNLLDKEDERVSSGKLDMIIQFPYSTKSDARKQKAQDRRDELEEQLQDSPHGIAYTDITEKIIQLNRPVENNLMEQVKYLTSMLYSQLGISEDIMNGTADEATMINYSKRTIEPIIDAIVEAMARTFLSRTARTQGQRVVAFVDPFKFVPMSMLADIADKLSRNEIVSPNDMRAVMGFKPDTDPDSDKLRNRNNSATPAPALPSAKVPALAPGTDPMTDPNTLSQPS